MKIKWLFDRVTALIGLIILAPLFLVIALVIKITMRDGPVLFIQQRVGQYGRLFKMVKFRTMRVNQGTSHISIKGDPRVTRTGAFLRKYKLDELPELWNVLKGDMSFVGPRPDIPGYADKLIGIERNLLKLKPGITGTATLKYRNEEIILEKQDNPILYNDTVIWPDKVKINLEYLDNHSFIGDIRIILMTIGLLK